MEHTIFREESGFRERFQPQTTYMHKTNYIEKANEYQLLKALCRIHWLRKGLSLCRILALIHSIEKDGPVKHMCILWRTFTQTYATATIHLDNDESKPIHTNRGVRQESTISPKIFTAAIEEVFKKLNLEKNGVYMDGKDLTELRFADDVALT